MIETFSEQFEDWTKYDEWLVQNYEAYSIFELNEVDGKIIAKYCKKSDFAALKTELEQKS